MFKHLRYRYELSERALVHHAKLAADAMVGKMLELWRDAKCNAVASTHAPEKIDPYEKDVHEAIRSADGQAEGKLETRVAVQVTHDLESLFLRHGDDGLLEHILLETESATDKRMAAVHELASALLNRRLYKLIGQIRDRSVAKRLYREFGGKKGLAAKRRLEIDVAREANLDEGWHIVLWIPKPDMRLKQAEVLVNDGRSIAELRETSDGQNRGDEIYKAHQALWATSVYVHSDVKCNDERRDVVLAILEKRLGGVSWYDRDNPPSLPDILVRHVRRSHPCSLEEERELRDAAENIAAHGASTAPTFDEMASRLEAAAQEIFDPQRELALDGSDDE